MILMGNWRQYPLSDSAVIADFHDAKMHGIRQIAATGSSGMAIAWEKSIKQK
jgi:hypothetical protein